MSKQYTSKGKKYTKIGAILNLEDKEGKGYKKLVLGEARSEKQEYHYEVQVMLKNSKGEKVLGPIKNPNISLQKPRPFTKKDGTVVTPSDKVAFEVFVVEEETQAA